MREQFRIVEDRLAKLGLPWRLVPGGKHPAYVVETEGRTIRVPVAMSPRDRRTAGLNTAKQIERAIGSRIAANVGSTGKPG